MCGQGGIKQAVKVRKQAGSQAIPPQMPSSSTPPSSQMTLAHMTPSSAPLPPAFLFDPLHHSQQSSLTSGASKCS